MTAKKWAKKRDARAKLLLNLLRFLRPQHGTKKMTGIYKDWARVTRFNPLWVLGYIHLRAICYGMIKCWMESAIKTLYIAEPEKTAAPLLRVSSWNDVWQTCAEIPVLISRHYSDLGGASHGMKQILNQSEVLPTSDVTLRRNQWWRREMLAVFSGWTPKRKFCNEKVNYM